MEIEKLKNYIEVINSSKSIRLLNHRTKIKEQEWFFCFDGNIPKHWLEVNFMDVTWLITCGVAKKPHYINEGIPFLSAQNTRPFKTNLDKIKFISENSFKKLTVGGKPEKNDILYTRVGNCGEAASIPYEFDFGVYVSLTLIKPIHELIYHKFLVAFLNSNFGKIQANVGAIGIGLKNLNVDNVRKYKIPLPPMYEQRAIVTKIENLFASLDKGIADLEKAQEQLKLYRQAVLSLAVTSSKKEPISELVSNLSQGWSPKCLNEHSKNNEEWAVIKTTAIQGLEFIDNENKILPIKLEPRKQHEIMVGDILITRAGPRIRVGICCLVRKTRPKLINCDKVYRLNVNIAKVLPDFFEYTLNAPEHLRLIEKIKSGSSDSGLNLTQDRFLNIEIPLPTIDEQKLIIKEIESRISVCDKVEQSLIESLDKSKALRQSILKQAFEGKLLSEAEIAQCKKATDYEPASVLLERIRKEKK